MLNSAEIAQSDGPQGKYRILSLLGEGGSATVYLAVARGPSGFSKLVVLKTLKRSVSDEAELQKMFLNEARLSARLNHPNVVQTNEVVEDRGLPIIVMEYLEGQPLAKVLLVARGGLPLATHLRIIADALNGLHHAHELTDFDGSRLGLVHRDMTPQNVFVTYDGQTKVLDFGIAKLASSNRPETETGVIKGKLRYMPPEQITGDAIDRRADIYAAGVMLWEAAAGEPMWKGLTDAQVMHHVLNGKPPSPRTVRPDLPERIEQICMKALSSEPDARHATAAELEADLECALDEIGSRVSHRSVGKAVSDLFAVERKQTRSLIEAQLSKVASLSSEEYEAVEASAKAGFLVSGTTAHGDTNSRARRAPGVDTRKRVGKLAAVLLGGASLVGIGVVSTLAGKGSRAQARPEIAPVASIVQAGPEKPPAARVSVRISASPPEAKLFFDGEPLPMNPFIRVLPADSSVHEVRAEAEGHQASTRKLVGDRDAEILLKLERAPIEQHKTTVAKAPAPRKAGMPSAPKPSCDPPFTIDSHGIKKFKVECL
ncbi:MAG TPA: protein kinase [Polyangiaceae bacterium]|nr:protein kinase [Polyangiaceae bacterium]